MPELDGVSIIALASFFVLVVAWLLAPAKVKESVAVAGQPVAERAAA